MRALWLENGELSVREDVPAPPLPIGEARVRVRIAGICRTDLELVRGYYPFEGVPGHEFVGVVEAAPGHEAWLGKRVVAEINVSCGACETCRAGRKTHCEHRSALGIKARNGAFAETLAIPVANLHEVPPDVADELAVFAEPLAAALEIQQQVKVAPGDRVVVLGDGKLGQLVARTLALTGCELLAIGRHPGKLALLEARGIRTALAPELAPGRADLVVECTGNQDGLRQALAAVRPRGSVVLKSTYRGETRLDASSVVVNEVTLIGSRCGPFAPALALLAGGRLDVGPLVEARYPLACAVEAFSRASQPEVLKVLVDC